MSVHLETGGGLGKDKAHTHLYTDTLVFNPSGSASAAYDIPLPHHKWEFQQVQQPWQLKYESTPNAKCYEQVL